MIQSSLTVQAYLCINGNMGWEELIDKQDLCGEAIERAKLESTHTLGEDKSSEDHSCSTTRIFPCVRHLF